MKKLNYLLLIATIIVVSLTGCSSNQKTEDELRAEIREELEEEAAEEEEAKDDDSDEEESVSKESDDDEAEEPHTFPSVSDDVYEDYQLNYEYYAVITDEHKNALMHDVKSILDTCYLGDNKEAIIEEGLFTPYFIDMDADGIEEVAIAFDEWSEVLVVAFGSNIYSPVDAYFYANENYVIYEEDGLIFATESYEFTEDITSEMTSIYRYQPEENMIMEIENSFFELGASIYELNYANYYEEFNTQITHIDAWNEFVIDYDHVIYDGEGNSVTAGKYSHTLELDASGMSYTKTEEYSVGPLSDDEIMEALIVYGTNTDLLSFDETFSSGDLKTALLYFDEHLNEFTKEGRIGYIDEADAYLEETFGQYFEFTNYNIDKADFETYNSYIPEEAATTFGVAMLAYSLSSDLMIEKGTLPTILVKDPELMEILNYMMMESRRVYSDYEAFSIINSHNYDYLYSSPEQYISDQSNGDVLMQSEVQLNEFIDYFDSIKNTEPDQVGFIWKQEYYYLISE